MSIDNIEDIKINLESQLIPIVSPIGPIIQAQKISCQINSRHNINTMANHVLPVLIRPRWPTIRTYAIVPYHMFYKQLRFDLDRHIKGFITTNNANNAWTKYHWLEIFPSTL